MRVRQAQTFYINLNLQYLPLPKRNTRNPDDGNWVNNEFATCKYGRPCTGYLFQTVIGRNQNLMPYFLTTSLTNANDVTRKYVYLLSLVSIELLLHEPSNMHKNVSKSEFCNKQPISALTLSFTKFMKAARRTRLCGQEWSLNVWKDLKLVHHTTCILHCLHFGWFLPKFLPWEMQLTEFYCLLLFPR